MLLTLLKSQEAGGTSTLTLDFLVSEGEVGNSLTLEFLVESGVQGGRRRERKRVFAIGVKKVELWEDDPLIETVERVEKALKLYRPVQKSDVQKLARLPGVKAALERAIRERDDEEAALMMLVA